MKRLFTLLLLATIPGCAGFEDCYYEEAAWVVPAWGGCQTPTSAAITATSSVAVPTASHSPAMQTREPDLMQSQR